MNRRLIITVITVAVLTVSIYLLLNLDKYRNTYSLNTVEDYKKAIDSQTPSGFSKEGEVKIDYSGEVSVAVKLLSPSGTADDHLVFQVVLNTHSVNLDDIDLGEMASIKNSEGFIIKENIIWEKREGSGHHILGLLKIPVDFGGRKIVDESTNYIELQIKGVAGIESRNFMWTMDEINSIYADD